VETGPGGLTAGISPDLCHEIDFEIAASVFGGVLAFSSPNGRGYEKDWWCNVLVPGTGDGSVPGGAIEVRVRISPTVEEAVDFFNLLPHPAVGPFTGTLDSRVDQSRFRLRGWECGTEMVIGNVVITMGSKLLGL
jgi:hypothetical protein